jgi:hypothetical protein
LLGVADNRVGFDLDQHVAINQSRHFDHTRRRADSAEDFAVRPADVLPITNIGHVDARPYDVFQPRASLFQRTGHVLQRLDCLRIRVASADNPSISVSGGCPGNQHKRTHPYDA